MTSAPGERESGGNRVPLGDSCVITSLACTTTPCPTAGWPPVTWKGSGAHVPLSVQAKPLEPCSRLLPTALLTRLRARLAGGKTVKIV
ncbi:unnamed protein product [Spirodela intermedia]|uniref:Uncharacterized protein n=1 Tax=Spirodela intermedia TaxID=51605 RepID=A0A7I8IH47_SPIIN|nr:unnamed protein product [Spirodela intermedia]CAA6657112.1 unnamed protein product [Spirodela intermedia]